jgi:hypothetical protein
MRRIDLIFQSRKDTIIVVSFWFEIFETYQIKFSLWNIWWTGGKRHKAFSL